MKEFYYEQELLEKFEKVDSPYVFALDMGLGKTQTLYEYVQRHSEKRILIIVNNIKQLNEMQDSLEDIIKVWHSKLDGIKFEDIKDYNIIGITKSKFFQLLLHEEYEYLNNFEEYYYDEFSGLSPIAASELIEDIASIVNKLRKNTTQIQYFFKLADVFKEVLYEIDQSKYEDVTVYNIKLSGELKGKAADVLNEYWELRKNSNIQIPMLDSSVIITLKSIINSEIFMSKFIVNKSRKYAMVIKNELLRTFIDHKKFIVLDATAELNKYDYEYLGITIDKNFSKNEFKYEELTINSYSTDVNKTEIRKGIENSLDKIVQLIPDNGRDIYTFTPFKTVEPLISTFGFDKQKIFYFFSGEDIGSNSLRDVEELNIICLQTYPKILRVVYNHVLFGYSLEKANRNEHDMAEWYMLARDLVQLIGRTAIRKHSNIPVTINLYQVDNRYIQLIKESHFTNCKINYSVCNHDSRSKADILLELIKYRLKQSDREYVYIEDLIENTLKTKNAISKFFTKNHDKLQHICSELNWEIIKKRGKLIYFENTKIDKEKMRRSPTHIKTLYEKATKTAKKEKIAIETRDQIVFSDNGFSPFLSIESHIKELIDNNIKTIKTVDFIEHSKVTKYYLNKYLNKYPSVGYIKGHLFTIN